MSQTRQLEVRHPYVNEVPSELMAGFEALRIDPEWQWVLVVDGKVEGQMLCAPMHGLLVILRVVAFQSAPRSWLVTFLRRVMEEARGLGLLGYVTFLSDRNPQEVKLMRIIQRSGGVLLPASGAWGIGSVEVRY